MRGMWWARVMVAGILAIGIMAWFAAAEEEHRVGDKPGSVVKDDKIDPDKGEPETVSPESVQGGTIVTKRL